jgi:hypothetical protein
MEDMMNQIKKKLRRIEKIKEEICTITEMRIGSLSEQWNVCGNSNCQCKDPEKPKKHGPYYQLSYTRHRKSSSEFVSKENLNSIRKQLNNYKTFMALKDEWIDLSIEISKLRKPGKRSHQK